MARDEAEPLVKPVRIDPRFVRGQLYETATRLAGFVYRVANQTLADAETGATGRG